MSSTSTTTDPPQLTLAEAINLAHAHWNAGQAQQAEQLCQRILAKWPQQADASHLLGLIAHGYGRQDLAISFMRQACQATSAPAIYFSNLAEMCRQQGLLVEAEQAGQQAVALAPMLVDAWNNLGIIQQEMGKLEESLESLLRVLNLRPDTAQVHNNLGNTYRRLDRQERAEWHYQQALTLDPNYAEAYSNLSFLLSSQGHFDEAVAAGRRAIELNPQLVDAYLNIAEAETQRFQHGEALHWLNALYAFAPKHVAGLTARAQVLKKVGLLDEALHCARQALALAPHDANVHNALGITLQAVGLHEEALEHFIQAAALPGSVTEEAMIAQGTLLLELGRKEAAADAFEQALVAFPGSIRALAGRSDSKTFKAGDADIAAMEEGLLRSEGLLLADKLATHFALGKAYLDTGESVRAFQHLNEGNRLKRSTFSYDPQATQQWMQRIAEVFSEQFMAAHQGMGAQSSVPVFIVGMPRSGTTLVEQILASHPQVQGVGELASLRLVVDSQGAFPQSLVNCSAEDLTRLGQDYLERIKPLIDGRDRLVDKMPANFLYAGLIPLILPGARIIHCRRDPVDTCLSCFSKQFGGEQLFTYDQAELGQFHRSYQALMAHWRKVVPAESFIEVDYEAVVDDLEGQARRLIDFIDLPWNDACLEFHKTERVVRTASVNQVRQPLYKTSKGRWHAHAEQLGPLLQALEPGKG
ncbi:tetratricopeptide repeat-containing sulfotransferase family protein [Pseudomonas fluorescens]|uniref:Lipopolysaccharide assembly protein B n=1 Tax=Pseudomonas fluorescens TaxID=294 RepID=A0A5E7MLV8_PSEFL|nr:tetratricopeptide repeat-containing sulfotransferase family protein [Pseudomonas fluorescens]VVP25677.1 Lipopolysaccharide assembly protein B [Pseudomonas fluorescens]